METFIAVYFKWHFKCPVRPGRSWRCKRWPWHSRRWTLLRLRWRLLNEGEDGRFWSCLLCWMSFVRRSEDCCTFIAYFDLKIHSRRWEMSRNVKKCWEMPSIENFWLQWLFFDDRLVSLIIIAIYWSSVKWRFIHRGDLEQNNSSRVTKVYKATLLPTNT